MSRLTTKMEHFCMMLDVEKYMFVLVDCHYCIMYNLKYCSFNYNGTDISGHNFYIQPEEWEGDKINFYVRNLYSSKKPTDDIISSVSTDELDFSSEIHTLIANSTISDSYSINNVMHDNLEYWSSELQRKPCSPVEIEIKFLDELVIKEIAIDWIKTPLKIKILFCTKNGECENDLVIKRVEELRSKIVNIYQKCFRIILQIFPDNGNELSYSNFCIFQIKKITLFKNEIVYKNSLSSSIMKNNTNQSSILDNDFSGIPSPSVFYSDNFYITKVEEGKINVQKQSQLDDYNYNSTIIRDEIFDYEKYFHKNLPHIVDNADRIEKNYKDYYQLKERLITILDKVASNFKDSFRNFTFNHTNVIREHFNNAIIHSLFNKTKLYFENKTNFRINYNYPHSQKHLTKTKKLLNDFISENSEKFTSLLSDYYKRRYIKIVDSLPELNKKVLSLNKLNLIEQKIPLVETALVSLVKFSKENIGELLDGLKEKVKTILFQKTNEMKNLISRVEILLQNIRLVKEESKKIYLNMTQTNENDLETLQCQDLNIITNTFYDNFLINSVISFDELNLKYENIIIFKFINKFVYYYLKITFHTIEIRKKKYDHDTRLIKYSINNALDANYMLRNFNKNVFMMIKVNKGKLSVNININYEPLPSMIIEHLKKYSFINDTDYDKLMDLYKMNENHFRSFFQGAENIFLIDDIDLFQNGYIGYQSKMKNMHFLMIARMPTMQEQKSSEVMLALQSKYRYNSIPSPEDLKIMEVNNVFLRNIPDIDTSWKIYDTQFQALSNFYFKFELDIDLLSDNKFYFFMDSVNTKETYFLNILKLQKFFIIKIFKINNEGYKVNLYRKNVNYQLTVSTQRKVKNNYTFNILKNGETLSFEIIKGGMRNKSLFTLKGVNFIKFGFLLNPPAIKSLSSIYFSDTMNFFKKGENSNNCTKEKYKSYKCIVKDIRICSIYYCKSCCTKKLLKENEFESNKCRSDCINLISKK
jgi:hypothetical protein